MATTFPCPACGQTIGANVAPGTLVRCPLCQQSVQVPGGAGPAGMPPPSSSGPPQFFNAPPPVPTGQKAGLAVAALVLGLCAVTPCTFWLGLPALICGFIALGRISNDPQRYRGRGMAIAGTCLGVAMLVLYPLGLYVLLPRIREGVSQVSRDTCRMNLVQIDLALKKYDKAERNPPQDIDDLLSKNYLPPNFAMCVSGMMHQVQPSYHYVPGGDPKADPRRIIVYEDPRNHGTEGGHVLHADGKVEFLSASELAEAIDRIGSSSDDSAYVEDEDVTNGDEEAAEVEDSGEEEGASEEDASSNAD